MAADFPVGLDASGAEARLLAGDEGTALSAWVGAAIAMVGMLVAACTIGTAAFLYQRHRNRSVTREVQKVPKASENSGKKPQAWPDPEIGAEQSDVLLEKASSAHTMTSSAHSDPVVAPDKLPASVRLELAETLRGILEDEISRGLKASGISDRLDRLEKQAMEQQVLSGSMLPPPSRRTPVEAAISDLDSTVKLPQARTENHEMSATLKAEATVPKYDVSPVPVKKPLCDAATLTEEERYPYPRPSDLPFWVGQRNLTLSPSARQKRYPDPPEKGWMHVDEDRSLRLSVTTVQRNLAKRDIQTQELHRQLRQTQQDCVDQKVEAVAAAKKLQDLLSDPTYAPQAQAVELQALRHKVDDLSGKLADSKQSERQWGIVAKSQRAFFMQSERVAQEGLNLFRKHPAGELFLAPSPVYLEDDDEDPRNPGTWDVGSSHINPYVNDSWPFEPNACAQRCAVEPNLGRWDEEDGIVDEDSDEEGSPGSGDDEHDQAHLMLRLPQLPAEAGPHDEDFEPPSPTEMPPDGLPNLGALSSRSL